MLRCLSLFLLLCTVVVSKKRHLNFNETKIYRIGTVEKERVEFQRLASEVIGCSILDNVRGVGTLANISIGTSQIAGHQQSFNVKLDFQNSITWVPATACASACESFCTSVPTLCKVYCQSECCHPNSNNPSFACAGKAKFDIGKSGSYTSGRNKTWTIKQSAPQVSTGAYGIDIFSLGDSPVTAKAEFGLATQLSLSYALWGADGILGLAKKAKSDDSNPIVSSLANPVVQMFIAAYPIKGINYGLIVYGSEALLDVNICQKVEPVTFKTNINDPGWSFPIKFLELTGTNGNAVTAGDQPWQATVDINAELTTLSKDLFEVFIDKTKATYDPNSGFYKFNCANAPSGWKISTKGKTYLVMPTSTIAGLAIADNECVLLLQPKGPSDTRAIDIILGKPVLTEFCLSLKPKDETITFYDLG